MLESNDSLQQIRSLLRQAAYLAIRNDPILAPDDFVENLAGSAWQAEIHALSKEDRSEHIDRILSAPLRSFWWLSEENDGRSDSEPGSAPTEV